MNTIWKFATASNIHFGRGCRNRLADELEAFRVRRPIVITDALLAGIPIIESTIQSISGNRDVHVFTGGEAEPSIGTAEKAIAAAQDHQADCVIGIGGGSNLDLAKATAVVLQHRGKVQDYFGFDAVPGPLPPVFALPTTAGTGSEVSHSAVLTDPSQATKVSMLSRWLRPSAAIVDPALTDSCPANISGQSGIDALVHAIEAYSNRDFSEMDNVDPQAKAYQGSYPLTRVLAAHAIAKIGSNLQAVVENPDNQSARDAMAEAAMLAGMAFSNSGVGIVHALEYPVGAITHCGHGEGNGLLLPHVMEFNTSHCETEFGEIAELLGCDTDTLDGPEAAQQAIDSVRQLQTKTGIRTRLRDLGLRREQIAEVASKAIQIRRLMDLNRRTPSEQDLTNILTSAF